MKRKRSSYPPLRRSARLCATPKECLLLQLPRELRVQILRHLLYSAKPVGTTNSDAWGSIFEQNEPNFTFYPAILRVCRQVHDEGCEILYRHNTAKANMRLGYGVSGRNTVKFLGYLQDPFLIIAHPRRSTKWDTHVCRFTKWDITVTFYLDFLTAFMRERHEFFCEVIDYFRTIPNLNKFKVRLKLYHQNEEKIDDSQDFEDITEQLCRPFSTLRVRKVDFVDQQGNSIRTTLSLSRLMMSDSPPPMITLHRLFSDLYSFLNHSLTEQSYNVVKARSFSLETAYYEYDVDAFRSALRSYLAYLSHRQGLVPPQHLAEFAQDSGPAAADWQIPERNKVDDSV